MFRKTNVELHDLTLEFATEMSQLPALPGERDRKPGRVEHLTNLIRSGKFVDPTWAVAIDKTTSKKYRANGQHSSYALSHLPADVGYPPRLMVTVETYTLDSMEDAHDLFDVFDSPSSVRNNSDYMRMCQSAYPDMTELPSPFLVQMMNGIDLHEATRPDGKHIPSRYRGDHFLTDPVKREFVLWAHTYSDKLNSHFMAKVGIVAEMYGDYLADRQIATEFWTYLIRENHPDADHETRDLARALNELITKPRVKQDQYRTRVSKVWKRYFRIAMTERQQPLVAEVAEVAERQQPLEAAEAASPA